MIARTWRGATWAEDAIRSFAGPDIERAVFYPEDDRFLIERGDRVSHYEVVFRSDDGRGVGGAVGQ